MVIVFGGVLGLMEVAVADVIVIVFVAEVVAVPVAVIVDQQRLATDPQQAAAERSGKVFWSKHVVGCAVGDHTARQQHHPARPFGLLQVMRGEHHRRPGGDLGIDDRQDRLLARQVESRDRFVEQQQSWGTDQCLRDEHTLALTARQVAERSAEQVGDLEALGHVADLGSIGPRDSSQQPAGSVAAHPDHLVDRQRHPVVVFVLLGDERRVDAREPLDRSGRRFEESGQQPQHRALAAAVRSDQCHRGAAAKRRGRRIERDHVGVPDGHPGELGERLVGNHSKTVPRIGMRVILSIVGPCSPPTTRRGAAVLATGTLLLAACGSDDDASTRQTSTPDDTTAAAVDETVVATTAPTVVATTSIWADVTANVACDGLAAVETIIPLGGDPHSFEPSLRDRETMDNAELVIANGLFLEESLADTIDAVESNGVTVLRVGDELDPLPAGDGSHDDDHDDEESDDHDHEGDEDHESDHDDHDHGDFDPHVWWDPARMAAAVPLIADALADAGVDRTALETCSDRYLDELDALDTEVAAIVAPLPTGQRVLVTNHDSLSYFADRYGFEVVGSVIPSSSSLAATSPAELDALAADIEATGVPAIFADTQSSTDDADALANRIGDVEVVSLLTGTLDEPGSAAGTYAGWLRQNVETIVDALNRSPAN